MAGEQRGRSAAGVTGIIDIPTFGGAYSGEVYVWGFDVTAQEKQRRGRGDTTDFPAYRLLWDNAQGMLRVKMAVEDWPAPDLVTNQTGTITYKIHAGRTIAVPVLITGYGPKLEVQKDDIPWFSLTYRVTGAPVFAGWPGTQPTVTAPSKTNKELYDGTSKTYDPQGLMTSAQRTTDIWGSFADTDAAEQTLIITFIAAANPPMTTPHDLKKRPATWARDSRDGATIVETWGLTDTAEDWINPRTAETIDPNKLQTGGTIAAINATPTVPTISGQTTVARKTTTTEINDSRTGQVTEYGQRDTKDDIEMDETQARIAKDAMNSEGQDTAVYPAGSTPPADAAAPHSSLQAVATMLQELNRDESKKVTYFRMNKDTEQWVYDRARALSDPSAIKNVTILGAIFTTGSEPSAPGASGLVLKDKTLFTVASPTTSNLSGVLWTYAETTSADDEIFPRTKLDTDPYDLTSQAVTGAIVTTGASLGSPSAPTTPAHMVLAHWTDAPLTDASASNKSVRLYFWELRTSQDAIEEDGTRAKVDNIGIKSEGQDTAVYTTSGGVPADAVSPDASLKAVAHEVQKLNRVKSKKVTFFDVNDSDEEWLYARTRTNTDDFSLKSLTILGAVFERGSAPDPPGASGLVLNHQELFDITSPDTSDLQGVLWFYGETTSADDEMFPRIRTETDPQDLKSTKITGAIFTTGSPGGDPSAPSGLKLTNKIDFTLTNAGASNKSLRLYFYAKLDSKDEIELLQSKATAEPGNVRKESIVVKVLSTATPVTDDTYNPDTTNLAFSTSEVHQITAAGTSYYVHVMTFKPLAPIDEEQESFKQIVDEGAATVQLIADDHRRIIDANATTAAPAVSGQICVRRLTHKIGRTLYQHDYWYGFRSIANQHIAEKTETSTDTSALESTAVTAEVWTVGSPPSTPTLSGYVLRFKIDDEIENPLYRLRIYRWGTRTTEQDITFKSRYVLEAGQIVRETVVIVVTASSTPDSTGLNPDATNLSLYDSSSSQETDAGLWTHTFTFRPLTAPEAMTAEYEGDEIDPAALDDESTRVLYNTTSTPDAAPAVSGKVHYRTNVRRVGKVKYRYIYKYRYRTSAEMLEALKTKTLIDISAIENEASTGDEWTVGSPPTTPTLSGFVLRDYQDEETDNPLYRLRVYRWGLTTRQQDREQDGTTYEVKPTSPTKQIITTINTGTSSLATLGAGVLATNQTTSTWLSSTVHRRNLPSTKYAQVDEYLQQDKTIIASGSHIVAQRANGVPKSGWNGGLLNPGGVSPGDTEAIIAIYFNGGNYLSLGLEIDRVLGWFVYRRVWITDHPFVKEFRAIRGRANDTEFLRTYGTGDNPGWLRGECRYAGAKYEWSGMISGNRVVVMDYTFYTDDWKFFNASFLPIGQTSPRFIPIGSTPQSGFKDASEWGLGAVCYFPREADFGGFEV